MAEIATQRSYAGEWDDGPIDTALTYIGLLMHAGEDAMVTFARMVHADPTPLYTYHPVARFGIECFARVHWLTAPSIGVRERVRRSLNERIASAYELSRLPKELDREPGRQDRLLKATQLGTDFAKQGGKGRAPSLGEKRPTITQLVKEVLGGERLGQVVYGHLSAVSHGTIWALAEVAQPDKAAPGPVVPAMLINSSSRINIVGVSLATAHWRANNRVVQYLDWGSSDWNRVRDETFVALRALLAAAVPTPT